MNVRVTHSLGGDRKSDIVSPKYTANALMAMLTRRSAVLNTWSKEYSLKNSSFAKSTYIRNPGSNVACYDLYIKNPQVKWS